MQSLPWVLPVADPRAVLWAGPASRREAALGVISDQSDPQATRRKQGSGVVGLEPRDAVPA